jgi:hypothetical protein
MRKIHRVAVTTAALLPASAVGVLANASPASAAATCLGSSNQHSVVYDADGHSWFHVGGFTTTSLCRDINIKTYSPYATACVVFVDKTDKCNYATRLPYNAWTVIATNVKDNVNFEVDIFNDYAVPVQFIVAA